jgi:hypothetical protein
MGLALSNMVAYYMTVAIQRWLGVRLDLFGNILILGIALFAAGLRTTTNPSKVSTAMDLFGTVHHALLRSALCSLTRLAVCIVAIGSA